MMALSKDETGQCEKIVNSWIDCVLLLNIKFELEMVTQADSLNHLLPAKFILIFVQILLLVTMLNAKKRFIYWEVGVTYPTTSD